MTADTNDRQQKGFKTFRPKDENDALNHFITYRTEDETNNIFTNRGPGAETGQSISTKFIKN
jgi:hypothetical protein